jgi:hypothetical protein
MPESTRSDLAACVTEFRKALRELEDVYRSGAIECARLYPQLAGGSASEFLERMLDLHRGLAMKVFVEVAHIDWHWSDEELVLARELFEHIWGRRLDEPELRRALDHVREQERLTWDALLGPFGRLAPLRNRADRLMTLVLRLANLAAKVDGHVIPDEVRQLQWIQAEMRRVLVRVPLDTGDDDGHDLGRAARHDPGPHAGYAVGPQAARERPAGRRAAWEDEPIPVEPLPEPHAGPSEAELQQTLAELDALIGLDAIKEEVHGLVNYLKMQKAREQFDLPQTSLSLHAVFSGNPGTGKTTVARLFGRILGAMGILKRGHLIETDRSGLVAEYAGQTGPKANKRIDEALDGVLFIDEAYSLVAETGDDPYGQEALQTLLKRMEDDRRRLVVVLAGYPRPMARLLRSNPGLSSRFGRHVVFPDYSAPELGRIFESMARANAYELPAATRAKLLLGFRYLLDHKDEHFGNGRLARNVFERAIGRLANRIAGVAPLTRELLTTLQAEDVQMDGVPPAAWEALADDRLRFHALCPGCGQPCRLAARLLGRTVQCKKCQQKFPADWGDPAGADD